VVALVLLPADLTAGLEDCFQILLPLAQTVVILAVVVVGLHMAQAHHLEALAVEQMVLGEHQMRMVSPEQPILAVAEAVQ